ncbi:GCN5-related N-acetyltransferase [Arthrobacter sp. PAMC 25486]|uniref:GNAT family N-acetyltransferase n=1 Tax=Arthrobacter sp. PAMC 25486 TaxID=1494608 RepID=UPI000535BD58|nr:GNAT family N-acetyltransferase [Arthrobacter sp. PAMC 25486]AIY00573.1 GCN5-related N-acetyltransferase [Arthrobacter sp. PAMC 25486]
MQTPEAASPGPITAPVARSAALDSIELLMDRAWPALESSTADGWVLRSASGVTQRANSIWPVSERSDAAMALREAENWYAARRQPVIFQLTHRPENASLEAFLDTRGYSGQSETIIMTAAVPPAEWVPPAGIAVTVDTEPSDEWLDLWWRVDGRGGAEEKVVARRILSGADSLYASARNEAGDVVGTGRLTIVDGRGGLYAMATHPDFRRQGVAAAVLAELQRQASVAGVSGLWLMVTAANTGAQALYAAAGFTEAGRYHYRQAAVGAC